MTRQRNPNQKNPPTKVERVLATLNAKALEEWNHLVRFNATYSELRSHLLEHGHEVTLQNISTWWATNRPRGREAIALNQTLERYRGVEPEGLLHMAAVLAAKMAVDLTESINIECATVESKMTALTALLREARHSSTRITKAEVGSDRDAMRLGGMLELAEELRQTFADSAIAPAIDAAVQGAIRKLE